MRRAWTPGTEGGKGLSCAVSNPQCFICCFNSPQLCEGDDGQCGGFTCTCYFNVEGIRHLFLVHVSIMSNLGYKHDCSGLQEKLILEFCAGQLSEWVKFVAAGFLHVSLKHVSYDQNRWWGLSMQWAGKTEEFRKFWSELVAIVLQKCTSHS